MSANPQPDACAEGRVPDAVLLRVAGR